MQMSVARHLMKLLKDLKPFKSSFKNPNSNEKPL